METIKKLLLALMLGSFCTPYAQVGINTTAPKAQLDISASNPASPANTDGLLIPKVNQFPATNPGEDQDGMLVYLTTQHGSNAPGFYFWKNATASWIALLNGGNSGTLDNAYDFGGVGNGRTITADNGAVTIQGTDGLVVTGSYSLGATVPSGAGTRMVWNPRKAAFRAGYVQADQWNDNFTGFVSAAFGFNTIASGNFSVAFGDTSRATGTASFAFGTNNTASSAESVAFGLSNSATGIASTAFGNGTSAWGAFATAFGLVTQATGQNSTAFGRLTTAISTNSTAFGNLSDATAAEATAFGFDTTASNSRATAFGYQTTASGQNSTTFGQSSIANAQNATAFGYQCQATNTEATAFGNNNIASGQYSTAFGLQNNARSMGETAIGMYCTNYTPASGPFASTANDRLFVIGNGSVFSRSDAMIVYKSGLATLPSASNSLIDGDGTGKAIVTKDWVNANKGNSLDDAYNHGGAGAGRFITANSGAVEIQGTGGLNVIGSGRVGIGTSNPRAALHVVGSSDAVNSSIIRYFSYATNPVTIIPWNGGVTCGYFEGNVMTNSSFVSANSVVFSDERIKKIKGLSNAAADLETLKALEIVDYTMIDSLSDTKQYKKVLAQQVEKFMPDAVSKISGYVPSIYALATETANSEELLWITLPKAHDLVQGDAVRLISETDGEILTSVDQIVDSRTFAVKNERSVEGKIFVYGKKVDDYRAVDYDAIAMLNVSATQELARQLESAKLKNAELERENCEIRSELEQLKSDVAQLKELFLQQQSEVVSSFHSE